MLNQNLSKSQRHILSYLILKKDQTMIDLEQQAHRLLMALHMRIYLAGSLIFLEVLHLMTFLGRHKEALLQDLIFWSA